jgi:hypothetical protein
VTKSRRTKWAGSDVEVRDFGLHFKERNRLEDLNAELSQTVDLWRTGPEGLVLYSLFGGSWQ